MKEAIKKAIEGGWKKDWYFSHFNNDEVAFGDTKQDSENNPCHYLNRGQILLDPLFWQCLIPKETKVTLDLKKMTITQVGRVPMQRPKQKVEYIRKTPNRWKKEWHRFIDHLASGKDPEELFNNLTK